MAAPVAAGWFHSHSKPLFRTLGTLLASGAVLAARCHHEWLAADTFLIARRLLVNSMPCWPLCAILTALPPYGCSATSLVIRHPPSHRLQALSWLLGVILVTGYRADLSASSWLLDAVLTTRRGDLRRSESVWLSATIHLLLEPPWCSPDQEGSEY